MKITMSVVHEARRIEQLWTSGQFPWVRGEQSRNELLVAATYQHDPFRTKKA